MFLHTGIEVLAGGIFLAAASWLTAAAAVRSTPHLLSVDGGSRTEPVLRGLLVATLFMVWPVTLLGIAGRLTGIALALSAAMLYLAARRLRRPPRPAADSDRSPVLRTLRWPLVLTAILLGLDLAAYLPLPPVDWDAATYHLYLPARWLQEHRLFHVPTVFGDNAAAFAPQSGALFFAWQMALSGRDALTNVSQLLCAALLGLALYRTARLLEVDRGSAALAALTLLWLAPVRRWTYSANVDVFMTAFAFAALYWQLLYLRRPRAATVAACGLAAGLAMGAKTLGLALVLLLTAPLVLVALRHRRCAHLGLFAGCATAGGGWWYLRNLWLYANPLFPVELSVGPWTLPGAYDAAALRAGEFHLEGLGAVAASAVRQLGPTTCLLAVAGLVVLAGRAVGDVRRPGENKRVSPAIVLLSLAGLWTAFFVAVVPHNNQARFLMPVLVIGLVGWALALQRARAAGTSACLGLWLAGIGVAAFASRPWEGWAASFATLVAAGVPPSRWIFLAAVCGATVTAFAVVGRRLRRPVTGAVLWVMASLILAIAAHDSDTVRAQSYARADYRAWAEGYLPFNHPAAAPSRIAYTGANVPYALVGGGWRHRVVYLNTQGEAGDGFYDFWRRERRRYPYHKPGIYRGHDDVEGWLERLAAERIDTLVIFALHWAERRYIRSTPDGFPVERDWVRRRPERFEPVFTGRAAEIYRVLDVPQLETE